MRRIRGLLMLSTALGAMLGGAGNARADINRLFDAMPADQQVRVIVSGWLPVASLPMALEARRDAMIAEARDQESAVLRTLQSTGQPAAADTPFRFLPFTVVDTTAAGARQLNAANPAASVVVDEVRHTSLTETPAMIGALEVRKNGLTGKGQVVAVLDTGVDTAHPFLKDSVIFEACTSGTCPDGTKVMFGDGAAKPVDIHGTHVAGIIAGHGDKFSGVAPEAKIIAINVFTSEGDNIFTRDSLVLRGFDVLLSLKMDRKVSIASINLSLGGGAYDKPCPGIPYDIGARAMREAGMLVVAASGNEKLKDKMGQPACSPSVVSVGAIDKQGKVARFSNSAPFLTILAPGVDILSSVGAPGKIAFEPLSGTSMATPHVAGAIALMRQAMPEASADDVLKALLANAPTVRDDRNGITTPILRLPSGLRPAGASSTPSPPVAAAPDPAPPPPTAALTPPVPARPASNWGSITQ